VLNSSEPIIRAVFDVALEAGADARAAANWSTGELTGWIRRTESGISNPESTGRQLAELITMVSDGQISASAAKEVLDGVLSGEGEPAEVARARDLLQISDTGLIASVVDEVLAANSDAVERFRSGEQKVIGFLVGQVMRASEGKADPKIVNELLREKLS